MAGDLTIYHNPRCSKSRATLKLLTERREAPQIIEYLKEPPTAARLKELLGMLGLAPRALMRRSEAPYKETRPRRRKPHRRRADRRHGRQPDFDRMADRGHPKEGRRP